MFAVCGLLALPFVRPLAALAGWGAARAARRRVCIPISWIVPVVSATGMNSPGGIDSPSAVVSRVSASKPTIALVREATSGWKTTSSPPASSPSRIAFSTWRRRDRAASRPSKYCTARPLPPALA